MQGVRRNIQRGKANIDLVVNVSRSFVVKLRQGSGKDRQGMGLKAKGLIPLPRAYFKVGCHHHHPPTTQKFNFTQLMARQWPGEVGVGKGRCVGSLWVTLG